MDKLRIYLAAPLFNDAERAFNQSLANILRKKVDVYLPQTDGILLQEAIAKGESPEIASERVFQEDIKALRECHVLLIVLNGRTIDEGAAFELGVAWTLGKQCVAYKDDPRQLLSIGDNPMITRALSRTLRTLDEVETWVAELCSP